MSKKRKTKKAELKESNPQFKQQYADAYCNPLAQAVHTYKTLKHEEEDLNADNIARALHAQNDALKANDSTRMEQILMMQAPQSVLRKNHLIPKVDMQLQVYTFMVILQF